MIKHVSMCIACHMSNSVRRAYTTYSAQKVCNKHSDTEVMIQVSLDSALFQSHFRLTVGRFDQSDWLQSWVSSELGIS